MKALTQRTAMGARQGHQTAIFAVGIIERDPQAGDGDGRGVDIGRVLVPADLRADVRLLEEVHGLQELRLGKTERCCQLRDPRLARAAVEHRIEVVQGMADLVQSQRHGLVRRLLLEEEADGAAGLLEVAVLGMTLVAGREDCADRARIEARHQLGRACLQGIAIGRRQEVAQDQKAVACIGEPVDHWTTRSMSTGLCVGAPSPMRIARRTASIAASASPSLAAWTMQSGLPARTRPPTSITSVRPTEGSMASSAWARPPPSATKIGRASCRERV